MTTKSLVLPGSKDRASLRFERQALYDEIWAHSLAATARKYQIKDSQMRGVCTLLHIPTPSAAYWQAVSQNKPAEPTPLPDDHEVASVIEVRFEEPRYGSLARNWSRQITRTESQRAASRAALSKTDIGLQCSFCGKAEVWKLIQGPAGVVICNECLVLCVEICNDEASKATVPTPWVRLMSTRQAQEQQAEAKLPASLAEHENELLREIIADLRAERDDLKTERTRWAELAEHAIVMTLPDDCSEATRRKHAHAQDPDKNRLTLVDAALVAQKLSPFYSS